MRLFCFILLVFFLLLLDVSFVYEIGSACAPACVSVCWCVYVCVTVCTAHRFEAEHL